jgi:hypothetical protein
VSDAADLGALDGEVAGHRRLEPAGDHAAGDGVLLEPEDGHGEVVQDVLRLELVVVDRVDAQAELVDLRDVVVGVDLSVRARMDEGPRPLLPDHPDRLLGGREELLHVVPDPHGADDDEDVADEDQEVGVGDPALLGLELAGHVLGLLAVLLAKLEEQPEEHALREDEPEADEDEDQRKQVVHVAGVGGGRGDELLDHAFRLRG